MRKTIIFLSSIGLQSYSLSRLSRECDLILVVDQLEITHLTHDIKQCFQKVIISSSGTYCGPIIKLDLDKTITLLQPKLATYDTNNVYIVNTSEANTLVAAELRQQFRISGLTPSDAVLFTDKSRMKRAVAEKGIRTPKSCLLSANYGHLSQALGQAFIVKPVDAAGSYGVELIHTQAELDNYYLKYRPVGDRFIAEQFISGTMYHCDVVIQNNKPIFQACSEYLFPNLDFKNGKNLSSFPVLDPKQQATIFQFSNQCLQALGYSNGIYHLELFVENGECFFLEVGARIPAALVVKMYEVTYGVNIADLSVQALTQSLDLSIQQNLTGHYFIWSYLAKTSGEVKQLTKPSFASSVDIQWEVEIGQTIDQSKSIIDRVGVLTAHNDCLESIQQDFENLREYNPIVPS
ncbi:ATP-grasp domain-containing protein [Vibrio profundum]|uniref:ATP-grasp domain-containing protein n=1 Tax=Vibrio profundum TaxID=2910247 RepID=UPI003D101497